MKNLLSLFIILMTASLSVNAKTAYVTDVIRPTLRSNESNKSKILKMVPNGSRLKILSENKDTGYSKVRTNSGTVGYMLTRHTQDKPISKWYLKKANEKLAALQQLHEVVNKELEQLKKGNNSTLSSNQSLTQERDVLSTELNELRQTAANAVSLKRQRDKLEERVISVEREFQQLKRENQTLLDSTNQDWFLYGGILSLIGVILGFILPKLSWRRKTSNWDTF